MSKNILDQKLINILQKLIEIGIEEKAEFKGWKYKEVYNYIKENKLECHAGNNIIECWVTGGRISYLFDTNRNCIHAYFFRSGILEKILKEEYPEGQKSAKESLLQVLAGLQKVTMSEDIKQISE